MAEESVGFIDWDVARVDASVLDFAPLPIDLDRSHGEARATRPRRAAVAWEVANGWIVEQEYAWRRLAELETLS